LRWLAPPRHWVEIIFGADFQHKTFHIDPNLQAEINLWLTPNPEIFWVYVQALLNSANAQRNCVHC
jgi:hypothetical protein